MVTSSIEYDETVWGPVYYYTMPHPYVYFFSCREGNGYLISAEDAKAVFSRRALKFARLRGKTYYFGRDSDAALIAEYEICRLKLRDPDSDLLTCPALLRKQLQMAWAKGSLTFPEYFTNCKVPKYNWDQCVCAILRNLLPLEETEDEF